MNFEQIGKKDKEEKALSGKEWSALDQWYIPEEEMEIPFVRDPCHPSPSKPMVLDDPRRDPRGFPLALALRGSIYEDEKWHIGDRLPSFGIIKLLVEKGARGISKKKAFELLDKTKGKRRPEEYEKIRQYLIENYQENKQQSKK